MKTYKEFTQNLDENKFTAYMTKKAAKQMLGVSSKLFSGKKSQGAKFLKKSVEGKNLRQKVANTLRGDRGIGTTHSQTKNTPAAKRMSEFELSKLDKQMNQSAGRFISGAKSGENYKAYQSPNTSFRTDMRATAKKVGGKGMLKQFDDLSKKSYDKSIKPSDAANALKKKNLQTGLMKKIEKSDIDPVRVNEPTLTRHQRMRGMSKKEIRNVNKDLKGRNLVRSIFGGKLKKRVGPTQHHKMRAQDTAIMKRSVANSDAGLMDILGGNPEGMRNSLDKFTYATIKKGKVPQPPGAKRTKTPKWMKSLNRHDDDFQPAKVDFKK